MAYTVDLEPGENVLYQAKYQASDKSEPFALAVSNRAIFIPVKKTFALTNDPYSFRRVPLSDVRDVRVRRLRPFFRYALALVMVVAGIYTVIAMYSPEYTQNGGRVRGWPFAVLVGGLALPFAARGRHALVVSQPKSTYTWKPPFVLDGASKRRISEILTSVVEASRSAGVHTVDDRGSAT